MVELAKAIGGIAWAVGIILLFVEPAWGIPILLVALLATLWVRSKDRERKHAELVASSEKVSASPPPPSTRSVADRLDELEQLKATGALSEAEYESQRKNIIESL